MNLKNFQMRAIADLKSAMRVAGKRDVILKSPTGSGKTVILTRFMQECMREDPSVCFVWLTPGKGNLEEQSKAKMDRYCHNASTKLLADVMTSGFAAGDAAFINWEKLTKKGANALKDSERTNFTEWIEKARMAGVSFKVVIDESHVNFTEKADAIVELFKTDKIFRASATPLNDPNAILVEVREEDVIAEGLIKKLIHINPDFPQRLELAGGESPTAYLLGRALEKLDELKGRFASAGAAVNPLMVVQLPNTSDALLDEVERWFAARSIDVDGGAFAVWLSNRHDNTDGIERNDAPQRAIVIKQAVATGWDCPRAHILVKLRENMDETFEIQTVGRVRRMPEARHYGDDALDSCCLYTFDEKFTMGVRQTLGKNALEAKKVFVKGALKSFSLVKEQRSMVAESRDPKKSLEAVRRHFAAKYALTADRDGNKARLEAHGYEFRELVWQTYGAGDVRILADAASRRRLNENELAVELDTHRHGRQYHHDVAEIGAGASLRYEDALPIVRKLFGERAEGGGEFLSFPPRTLYAFVINNADRLKNDFREAMSAGAGGASQAKTVEKPFHIPHEWIHTYDKTKRNQNECGKNAYKGYLVSAEPRSRGEARFEKWCEQTGVVEWFYRNGDKGDEYFSIAYEDNSGHQRLFYPDYILRAAGETWIVEVKGGWNGSGQSQNIDPFAAKKAAALDSYCARHGLRGGFVCHDDREDILLVSETGYSDDVKDPCWKPLSEAVKAHSEISSEP